MPAAASDCSGDSDVLLLYRSATPASQRPIIANVIDRRVTMIDDHACARSLRDREARLAVDPAEVALEPAGHRNGEELGDFVRMKLTERATQSLDTAGARLEQQYCLAFVGNLAFPAINRAR